MLFSLFSKKENTDDDIEIELPTFSYKPLTKNSSLLRRQLEEQRFNESGAVKEKLYEIL